MSTSNVVQFPGSETPKEIFREVRSYIVNVQCPECDGIMRAVPIDQMSVMARNANWTDYSKHPHRCDKCGHEAVCAERYPTLRTFYLDDKQPV